MNRDKLKATTGTHATFESIPMKLLRPAIRSILRSLPLIAFPRLNVILNKLLGYSLDGSARIYSSASIMGAIEVSIGPGTFVGHQTLITGGMARIVIGANCDISDRVGIFCGTHKIDAFGHRSAGYGTGKDIMIEDGVWIGFGALILPGVTIGKKAVVAAGTVVHKDVPAFSVVGGNPMKVIKKLDASITTPT